MHKRNKNLKVSIIIPYDKDRGYLNQAIKSCICQTYKNVEVILAQGPGNAAENFNAGLQKAKGDLIRKLDEDDYLPPDSIALSVAGMDQYDFTHGNAYTVKGSQVTEYISPVHQPTAADLINKSSLHEITVMYRRDVFDRFGLFDETLEQAQTYDFHLRILSQGAKVGYINRFLVYYRHHDKQISRGDIDAQKRKKILTAIKSRYHGL